MISVLFNKALIRNDYALPVKIQKVTTEVHCTLQRSKENFKKNVIIDR